MEPTVTMCLEYREEKVKDVMEENVVGMELHTSLAWNLQLLPIGRASDTET